jgi:hypothetical protein
VPRRSSGSILTFAQACVECQGAGRRSSAVEQGTHKPLVAGSNPAVATVLPVMTLLHVLYFIQQLLAVDLSLLDCIRRQQV